MVVVEEQEAVVVASGRQQTAADAALHPLILLRGGECEERAPVEGV